MRYYVTWHVEGSYTAIIDDANSIEEAKEKSRQEIETANLNELSDVWDYDHTKPVSVQDESLNRVWEEKG